jgi:nucleotide-binding universal stress UspA family protein
MIVVGVDDSPRSEDAIALAGVFARASRGEVLAVYAFPYDDRPEAHFNLDMRTPLLQSAEETLDRLCQPLDDDPHVRRLAVADLSPARALQRVAAERHAELIVVGSSHAGHVGRLLPGSTAERLLQGAPCPVALAPQGHRLRPRTGFGRVTAGYDGTPESSGALEAAARVAHATGAELRVVRVFTREMPKPPSMVSVPGYVRMTGAAEESARDDLERVSARLGAEPAFLHGDPARELARESEVADLLVVGSRGYGPLRAVLLGGVSGRVAHTAACPLLIVPHGAEAPLAGLFQADMAVEA